MTEMSGSTEIRLEEYKSLREETIQRLGLGDQMLNLLFVVAAAVWTIGTVGDKARSTLLIFPWLACFCAARWAANAVILADIGLYIRVRLEGRYLRDLQWATYLNQRVGHSKRFNDISTLGIFLGSEIVSIVASQTWKTFFCWEFLLMGLLPFACTWVLLSNAMLYPLPEGERKVRRVVGYPVALVRRRAE